MTRKLHIGGRVKAEGWEVLNISSAAYVDHICNATDLSRFDDNTFDEIYASHIVEHLDYAEELPNTLVEWNRVLTPGGKIYISVPDLDVLSRFMLTKDTLTIDDRFKVMTMIFGGHMDKHDYHMVGLNEEFLRVYLQRCGYVNIEKVDNFGLFDDTSSMVFKGVAISVNLIAEKPVGSGSAVNSIPSKLEQTVEQKKVGRNQSCPCGSGKKFKHCCGRVG